jgi:hypothetical protein
VEAESKIDPGTRRLLAQDGAAADQMLSVFVRGRGELGEDELTSLREQGAEIRTVAGNVCTANVPLSKVADVAAQDFVVRVEGSSPLYAEQAGSPPTSDAL